MFEIDVMVVTSTNTVLGFVQAQYGVPPDNGQE
jgi:hypothetical protein